jgi:hypothetical protein
LPHAGRILQEEEQERVGLVATLNLSRSTPAASSKRKSRSGHVVALILSLSPP